MTKQLALLGNPNSGKSTIFNYLTGLYQKTGNYPGVTVERKTGKISNEELSVQLVDLPGTYSLYPLSSDEKIINKILLNPEDPDHPDGIVYILDVTQFEKHLLLYTQIRDLGFPIFLVINMMDLATKRNIILSEEQIKKIRTQRILSCHQGRSWKSGCFEKRNLRICSEYLILYHQKPLLQITA